MSLVDGDCLADFMPPPDRSSPRRMGPAFVEADGASARVPCAAVHSYCTAPTPEMSFHSPQHMIPSESLCAHSTQAPSIAGLQSRSVVPWTRASSAVRAACASCRYSCMSILLPADIIPTSNASPCLLQSRHASKLMKHTVVFLGCCGLSLWMGS